MRYEIPLRRAAGEDWTTRRQDWLAAVHEFVMGVGPISGVDVGSALDWVSGELDPEFFKDPQAIALLDYKLGQGTRIRLLFNAGASSYQEAEAMVDQDNQEMADIKRKHPDRLHLFWVIWRLRLHFMVAGENVLHEEPDHPPGLLPLVMTRRDRKWAREWKERFNAIAKNRVLAHELFSSASPP